MKTRKRFIHLPGPLLFVLAILPVLPACGDPSGGIAMYAAANSGLVVRSAATTNSKRLGLIPYRGQVMVVGQGDREETIAGQTGRWARIQYAAGEGGEAWVFGGFLTASVPDEPAAGDGQAPLVRSLQLGDVACYVELDYGGRTATLMAEPAICELSIEGKRIRFQTHKANVIAESCEGDPDCDETESVDAIYSVEVQ